VYEPCTGHAGRTGLTGYSTHQVLVVWIIVAHFHLCGLLETLSHYTVLEVEQFDDRCVFAVAADGDGACFSLTFWTV